MTAPREEEVALVRDALAGDEAAMERLLMRAQEVAWRFSLAVCGRPDDAEDAMTALTKLIDDGFGEGRAK